VKFKEQSRLQIALRVQNHKECDSEEEEEEEKENVGENVVKKCLECDQIATVLCDECHAILCKDHDTAVHKFTFTKDHSRSALSEKKGNLANKYCSVHPKERLKLFCETDKVLICAVCALEQTNGPHSSHKLIEGNTAMRNYSALMVEQLKKKKDNLEKHKGFLKTLQDNAMILMNDLLQKHNEFDENAVKFLKELKICLQKCDDLSTLIDKLCQKALDAEDFLEFFQFIFADAQKTLDESIETKSINLNAKFQDSILLLRKEFQEILRNSMSNVSFKKSYASSNSLNNLFGEIKIFVFDENEQPTQISEFDISIKLSENNSFKSLEIISNAAISGCWICTYELNQNVNTFAKVFIRGRELKGSPIWLNLKSPEILNILSVTASSSYGPAYNPSNILLDNNNQYWCSKANVDTQDIVLELAEMSKISKIILRAGPEGTPKRIQISSSPDKFNWNFATSFEMKNDQINQEFALDCDLTKYIQITMTSCHSSFYTLNLVQLWGASTPKSLMKNI
jgi:hypothetical protein